MHGLRALGDVEGQNLILERRSAEERFDRLGDLSRVAYLLEISPSLLLRADEVIE